MKSALQRAASKVAETVHEMNEAQRLMLVLNTSPERYARSQGFVPDTYQEFMARTSGVLRHEPSARRRARAASRWGWGWARRRQGG